MNFVKMMNWGKENTIISIAILLLLIGIISNIYVHATKSITSDDFIEIDGKKLSVNEIFSTYESKTIQNTITKENYTGVSLEDIIKLAGIKNPEAYSYTIIGSDGYRKTVKWEDIESGILTKSLRVVFEDLPKAYMVRDVVKIEVIG
ncbi:MAG TPA: hypothetical protein ENI14_02095 [Thermoplasmatales archaeon]|nr:hypothetical protein [Thermoplasmatales archaeon]